MQYSHALRQIEKLDDKDSDAEEGQSCGPEGHLTEAQLRELFLLLGLISLK